MSNRNLTPTRLPMYSPNIMKQQFTDAQIADFLRRSYFVVDGMWFIKTEEKRGFDEAMELDAAVWDVISKVQARKARDVLGITGTSVQDLARAFELKLACEGHDYEIEATDNEARITIGMCPWYEMLKSSGRTDIARVIAERICAREFAGWIREFSPDIDFAIEGRLCVPEDACEQCTLVFYREDV